MISVSESTVKPAAGRAAEFDFDVAWLKFVPVIVTMVPPVTEPKGGETR